MGKLVILTNCINGLRSFRIELVERLISEGFEVVISGPDIQNSKAFIIRNR